MLAPRKHGHFKCRTVSCRNTYRTHQTHVLDTILLFFYVISTICCVSMCLVILCPCWHIHIRIPVRAIKTDTNFKKHQQWRILPVTSKSRKF